MADSGDSQRQGEAKPRILFLCHRVPFPPNKGDKIRSYHWLLALAGRFRVSLGAFVDSQDDWKHQAKLRSLCDDVLLVPLDRRLASVKSLGALLHGEPLSIRYYLNGAMKSWVRAWSEREAAGAVLVFSSAMAQYVAGPEFSGRRRVIDFVDVDAEKWREYAARRRGAAKWVYRREARTLARHDLEVAERFDVSLFVSAAEADLFSTKAKLARRVVALENGVDSDYFSPERTFRTPFESKAAAVVFTGAMDYWPNVDAVCWFVRYVWPAVRRSVPQAVFYVVGARPAAEVMALSSTSVIVTGTVEDVRPYLRFAKAVVAPMRVARGIQNKVLEGMAMARPVVVTSAGAEGLSVQDGEHLLVADEATAISESVVEVLRGQHAELGYAARARVRIRYDWASRRERLAKLVASDGNTAWASSE